MALLNTFHPTTRERYSVHDAVECSFVVFVIDGKTYLQLDTFGSEARKIPGKVSQSIQLNEASARQLLRLLRDTFQLE